MLLTITLTRPPVTDLGYLKPGRTAQAVLPRRTTRGELSPQLTAFLTSAPILASSAAVNSVRAKTVGHMAPSSRFAVSLKPKVAYLDLELVRCPEEADHLPVHAVATVPTTLSAP